MIKHATDHADLLSNITLTDPTISNHHLLIYTINLSDVDHQCVFVYAKDISTNGSFWRYKYGNNWKELLIGRDNAVLLSDGDKVRLCNGSCFSFQSVGRETRCSEDVSTTPNDETKVGPEVRQRDSTNVSQLFMNLVRVTNRKLGSGGCGEVWMAVDNIRKCQMACKIVKLEKPVRQRAGRTRSTETVWREVELLKDISHVRKEVL